MDKITADKLVIGKKYRFYAEDCCVSIDFTAILTSIVFPSDYTRIVDSATFDNGVTIHSTHASNFQEVQDCCHFQD